MSEYDPSPFFSPRSIDQAKAIILTGEDSTTDHRWRVETPYLAGLIAQHVQLGLMSNVMDFGCGVGRVSKELIARTGCSAFGVDFSPVMRALAPAYVESNRFLAAPPEMMTALPGMDAIVAIWVLQHVMNVEETIGRLVNKLKRGGRLFVVNGLRRSLPTGGTDWFDDELDVHAMLSDHMSEVTGGALDPQKTTPLIAKHSWWGVFEPR